MMGSVPLAMAHAVAIWAGGAVPRTYFPKGNDQLLQLFQVGIVRLSTVGSSREGVLAVEPSGKSPLFQHHVGEKGDMVFLAIIEDASPFRGAMEQTEVILNS